MKNFDSSIRNVFQEAFQYFLNKSFDIRIGEYRRVLLMQLNIFLIISTLLIVKPIVNSLFLSSFGFEFLPVAFIVLAVLAIGVSWMFSRLFSRFPFQKIMIRTLLISVVTLFVFGVLLRLNFFVQTVLFLFYVWVAIFAVVTSSQFWVLANMVFNPREAKRVFGFIGAGAIAGGIFGGYLTSILAPVIGSENLIFMSMLVLLPTYWVTKAIWKDKNADQQRNKFQKIPESNLASNPIQIILKSRHLSFLAGIIAVSVIVAKLVDYQFSAIASVAISDPDQLTSFFGFWFSNFNLLSLFIQLFITRRVVGVFGVGTSLLILPAAILLGAVCTLFFPILGAAVFIKMSDGSLKQSINKSATELLALPIPVEFKNKTKSFIDVFVDSAATGIGGLILIFLVNGLDLSTNFISLMIIGLLFVWGYFALQVRKEYIKSFKLIISSNDRIDEKNKKTVSPESIIGNLIKQLESEDEKQLLYVLRKIGEVRDDRFFPGIKKLLDHNSAEVRAKAIINLRSYLNHNLSGEMVRLVNDPDQQVRVNAFEYLLVLAPGNRVKLIESYLQHEDEKLSEAALLALAVETKDNPELQNWFSLGTRIQERIELMKAGDESLKKEQLKLILTVIGIAGASAYYRYIEEAFHDPSPDIVTQAIEAAGDSGHPQFVSSLVGFLVNPMYTTQAQIALAKFGTPIYRVFHQMIDSEKLAIDQVRMLPAVAEKIDSQATIKFLFALLDFEDYLVHQESLKSLNSVKSIFPHLVFDKRLVMSRITDEVRLYQNSLVVLNSKVANVSDDMDSNESITDARKSLIDILERRLDASLERIFRLLELRYPPEDILTVYKGIQSDKTDLRMNAVEFLDNLLESRLKKVLIPILETAISNSMTSSAGEGGTKKEPDEIECYQLLLDGIDVKLKLAVFYLLEQLADASYLSLVAPYLESQNPKIRTFAQKANQAMLASRKVH
ncbi:hypothetical protein [Sunxiuqinia indica]|uniref:hypothetical protein n=1 Tax=Sunxiuqinia indica TaxID=2692584 RepID=UPI00135A9E4E|nr:hypothetical protein [Sunxiuqinia indica]